MKKMLILLVISMMLFAASTQDTLWLHKLSWHEHWGICLTDTLEREVTTAETTVVRVDLNDYLSYHGMALMEAESTTVLYAQSPDLNWIDIDWTSWFATGTDTTAVFKTLSLHPARYLEFLVIEEKADTTAHTVLYFTMFK